jgi:C1A family cysteine protease
MTKPRKISRYGWIPDQPDQRDHLYAAPPQFLATLPPRVDLRRRCPPVYNQGALGSCTANAIGAAVEFERMKQKLSVFVPSRLFIYYNERVIEHTVRSDSGAQIRDGIKSVASIGACPEKEWPYVIAKFASKPPQRCYNDAKLNRAVSYQRLVQDLNQMKGCLASGYPFVFGFAVYESFESSMVAKTGHAPMPMWGERMIGGHAVMAVGYDDSTEWFIVRNSWGKNWGISGYFTLPYTYFIQPGLSSDFWTIRLVGN